MGKLEGKIAVVTGAAKGIGAEIARELAAEGASVVVNYATSRAEADQVVAGIGRNGGKAVAVQADVSKSAEVERLFAETKKSFGSLDILVNNAGVYEFAPLEKVEEQGFHRQFGINVLGLILSTREAVKLFGDQGGCVINVGSLASTLTLPDSVVYSATKAAVDAVTHVLAKELGPRKIRVNSINPGVVETEGFHAAGLSGGDFEKNAVAKTPLGRVGQPRDIAPLAVFLASPESQWLTGQILLASGGLQ
jgi:3-oxoacyl-[acyl-carrier protein] reductase